MIFQTKSIVTSSKNKNIGHLHADCKGGHCLLLFNAIIFIALFFINPLYTLIILTISNFFLKIKLYILMFWGFFYSTLIFNREYNISFIPSGGDDVIGYAKVIENLRGLNFIDIFNVQIMSGYEPIAQIFWWVLVNIGLSVNQIVFLQLFAWVVTLILLANYVSKRFSVFILIIGLGLYPEIIPLQFHTFYRSSWAFMFLALSIIYFKNRPINILTISAFFSHFITGIIIFFQLFFAKNIFNRRVFIILFFSMLIFYTTGMIDGLISKLIYYSSSYTHIFDLSIVKSQLLGIATLLLFYYFSSKDLTCKYMFYSALMIFILTFIPFISWISMRLFVFVAPIAFMVCAPVRNRYVLYGVTSLSLFRYVSNISSEYGIYNAWGTEFIFISFDKIFGIL